eukprot:scaffold3772_cov120-Isochrysis_galbana.AAC.3
MNGRHVQELDAADRRSRACVAAAVRRAVERSSGRAALPQQHPQCRRRAFVTLLTTSSYARGVIALRQSLAEVGSTHTLIVMVGSAVPQAAIAQLIHAGCEVRHLDAFALPPGVAGPPQYECAHFADCWMKLHMWEWDEEFDLLVYLDADMIVLKPIDHLLDCDPLRPSAPARVRLLSGAGPTPAMLKSAPDPRATPGLSAAIGAGTFFSEAPFWIGAVQECFCPVPGRKHLCPYPADRTALSHLASEAERDLGGAGRSVAFAGRTTKCHAAGPDTLEQHGSSVVSQPRAAVPQPNAPAPDSPSGAPPTGRAAYFNAGLLVLRPHRGVARAMAAALRQCDLSRFPFAEQDFLNFFFSQRWLPLKWEYNATKALFGCHREAVWNYSHARVLHYTMAKPWELRHPCHRGFAKLNTLWLAAYSEPSALGRVLLRLHLEDMRRRRGGAAGNAAGNGQAGD